MTEKTVIVTDRITQQRSFQMPVSALGLDKTAGEVAIIAATTNAYLNQAVLTAAVTVNRAMGTIVIEDTEPETDSLDELKLEQYELVYQDATGAKHYQPVADLTEVGTLIDPETGDDMELIALRRVR